MTEAMKMSSSPEHRCSLLLFMLTLLMSCAALADTAPGEKLYLQCQGCHMIGPEAKNQFGPQLNGVLERKPGSAPGYEYSAAFNKALESGLTWDEATLDEFLRAPMQYISGTKMAFPGIKSADDRRALIDFMKTLGAGEQSSDAVQSASDSANTAVSEATTDKMAIPPLSTLAPPTDPADNPATPEKVALGKQLFWDGRLSGNGSFGCVVCHQPTLGWGTGGPISFGYPGTQHWRNSQTILNSAYYNKLFWEGSATSLESQAPAAAGGGVAGNGDGSMMEMRLRFVPAYVEAFKAIFGTEWPNVAQAWQAIAAFERTIVTDATKVPFDRYLSGDESALSPAARRGMDLYSGKANCIACHNGALASDERYYNLGVPGAPQFAQDPVHQITLRWELYQKGGPENIYRVGDDDLGLYHKTKRPTDKGKFRTPSLRELRWTAPYMHNGIFASLDDVITFYDAGGGAGNSVLKPLGLTDTDKTDLIAFLEAMSMDEPLLMQPPELPATSTWAEFD